MAIGMVALVKFEFRATTVYGSPSAASASSRNCSKSNVGAVRAGHHRQRPTGSLTRAHGAVSHRATSLSPRTSGASSATSSAIAAARCGKSVRSTSA